MQHSFCQSAPAWQRESRSERQSIQGGDGGKLFCIFILDTDSESWNSKAETWPGGWDLRAEINCHNLKLGPENAIDRPQKGAKGTE